MKNRCLIRTDELEKRYGAAHAVRGVSFSLDKPGLVAIIGANGAGKTTLMRMLSGALTPTSGVAEVMGHSVVEGGEDFAKNIGYLSERLCLYEELRVEESLWFFAQMRGLRGEDAESQIQRTLADVGLLSQRRRLVSSLSKGYRQRVGLAQALLHDPTVLILDEPFSGFDPLQRVDTRQMLVRLARQRLVVFSTHVLSDVESLASRILILVDGELVADGTLESLTQQVGLRSWYEVDLVVNEQAKGRLEELDGVLEVRRGEGGHLEVEATGDFPEALNVLAREHQWTIRSVNAVNPSLEDVFIALTGSPL